MQLKLLVLLHSRSKGWKAQTNPLGMGNDRPHFQLNFDENDDLKIRILNFYFNSCDRD